ncbi:MAG: hypothetical protein ACYC09_11025 [Bacteroidota bacterium]
MNRKIEIPRAAHTLSTIIVGIIVGVLGYTLSSSYQTITTVVAPAILILLGLVYLVLDWKENRDHEHHHHHHIDTENILATKKKNKSAIVFSLAIGMFFSPCIEIEAYYFSAGILGWPGIITVSIVYFFITIAGMLALVSIGMKGVEKFKFHFLEHHEKLVTGSVLILLGIVTLFIH